MTNMKKKFPMISVVIPLYNREETIQRAVDSVLNQTYTNIEVIVVDDGSTDHSRRMLEKYANDNRVRVFTLEKNKGANAARNKGIQEAKGEYIAFQDSDDEWVHNKLEKQVLYMLDKNLPACFCAYKRFFGSDLQIIPQSGVALEGDVLRETLKKGNVVGTPTLVISRQIVNALGLFDEAMPRLQDYEYVIRIIKQFDMGYINEPLVNEYQLSDSISLKQDSLSKAQILLLKKHSDFLDVKKIWNDYLAMSSFRDEDEIDWNLFDNVINEIVDGNPNCTNELLYRETISFFNRQYRKVTRCELRRYDTLLLKLHNTKFAIYGAGRFGREVYYDLKEKGLKPQCFLVTTKSEDEYIDNVKIYQASEWKKNDLSVIIAVLGEAQFDIMDELDRIGITDYYVYPRCL